MMLSTQIDEASYDWEDVSTAALKTPNFLPLIAPTTTATTIGTTVYSNTPLSLSQNIPLISLPKLQKSSNKRPLLGMSARIFQHTLPNHFNTSFSVMDIMTSLPIPATLKTSKASKTPKMAKISSVNMTVDLVDSKSIVEHVNADCIIFDWDDTILPLSTLRSKGYLSSIDIPNKEKLHFSLLDQLKELDTTACSLLIEAFTLGTVFIITNAEQDWVKLTSQLFLPKFFNLLTTLSIHIISARDAIYSTILSSTTTTTSIPTYTDPSLQSKVVCFDHTIKAHFNTVRTSSSKPLQVISIGDALYERIAAQKAVSDMVYFFLLSFFISLLNITCFCFLESS